MHVQQLIDFFVHAGELQKEMLAVVEELLLERIMSKGTN